MGMNMLSVAVKKQNKGRKILIEMDAKRLEKLASLFGFFNPEFIKSLQRAEKDFKSKRIKKVSSLSQLRKCQ